MNANRDKASIQRDAQPGTAPTRERLNVEVRVREVNPDSQADDERSAARSGRERILRVAVLAAVLLIAGIYVGLHLGRGWVPADDGILAQSALRVSQGQLPHRDFAEIYTGGLSMLHALAFRALGVNLMSLRICVFLFFLAWIPAVYYIALRFTSALGAGLVTLLAVSWSLPNYPAAMPSWYNLFFATFGAAALLRYLETKAARWLFVAGLCGGLSIVIKVIGAYYLAGAALFLAFLEQSELEQTGDIADREKSNRWFYRAFTASAFAAYLGALIYVLHTRLTRAELYHFVLPSVVMIAVILLGESKVLVGSGRRLRSLLRLGFPFASGVAIPIVIFLIPYALSGSLGSLISGMRSSIAGHVADLAVIRPAPPQYVVFVLPLLGLLAAAMYWDKFQGRVVGAAIGLGAIVIVARSIHSTSILSAVWFSAVMLTPVVVVLGATAVIRAGRTRGEGSSLNQHRVMLLTSLAATCSLVQYPLAAPIYLCYSLPLTMLALVAIVATSKRQSGTYVLTALAGLYIAFGVVALVPMQVAELTHEIVHMDKLQLPRGGVTIENEQFFEQLIHFLQAHSPNGVMYAGNDCPELYFLAGLKDVTHDDGGAPAAEVLRALQSNQINVVVINEAPFFPAGRMNPQVRAEVERQFPNHAQAGIFQVFWKQ